MGPNARAFADAQKVAGDAYHQAELAHAVARSEVRRAGRAARRAELAHDRAPSDRAAELIKRTWARLARARNALERTRAPLDRAREAASKANNALIEQEQAYIEGRV